ncbi:hypothetical protein BASA50_005596 [Batrachochytrium salamandrivorans]|uniref:Uncharacterized protein n=1 Tax=Batrachochytrium salamandrivorans TaxID=1357716 RepID=A0ABQ8FCA9_9FUNG|nr:hypothetical protein BASA60_006670 [Batrachochytrium salamandrivorans]KAH6579115.1 hypothetical protein BASA60_003374 [Batrachochytrium salamandrivorans]KAH6584158.1 hypothetical protein BASA61_007628 [Batrachochytrium salamandrivorans]KAH6595760.1 hypothetical protein BASA50_005596 [Batrachochytrium salamandrivorans]KAH9248104.1 hypothetical protein BASA81_014267 [Batrachochytrium salamandrivorans]
MSLSSLGYDARATNPATTNLLYLECSLRTPQARELYANSTVCPSNHNNTGSAFLACSSHQDSRQREQLIHQMSELGHPELDRYAQLRHAAFQELNQSTRAGSARFVAQMRWLDSLTPEERASFHTMNRSGSPYGEGTRRRRHTTSDALLLEPSSQIDDGRVDAPMDTASVEYETGASPDTRRNVERTPNGEGLTDMLYHLSSSDFGFCAEYERDMCWRHRSLQPGSTAMDGDDCEDVDGHTGSLW